MNMVDFGYALALVLIAMIVIARAYPLAMRRRAGAEKRGGEGHYAAREVVPSWSENELSSGRADSAAPGYI